MLASRVVPGWAESSGQGEAVLQVLSMEGRARSPISLRACAEAPPLLVRKATTRLAQGMEVALVSRHDSLSRTKPVALLP